MNSSRSHRFLDPLGDGNPPERWATQPHLIRWDRHRELHINRIPSFGLGRSGLNSWISRGLHALVDGETHFAPMTYLVELLRNALVDYAEAAYYARAYYVY